MTRVLLLLILVLGAGATRIVKTDRLPRDSSGTHLIFGWSIIETELEVGYVDEISAELRGYMPYDPNRRIKFNEWANNRFFTRDTYQWWATNTGQTLRLFDGLNGSNLNSDFTSTFGVDINLIGQIASNVVVGVLDTGCYLANPYLQNVTGIVNNRGVIEPLRDMDDRLWHGTRICGLVAGYGPEFLGAAPGSELLVCGVATFSDSELLWGLAYMISNAPSVLSISWGRTTSNEAFYAAWEMLSWSNVTVTAALPNRSFDLDTELDYPSSYGLTNIIPVAGVDMHGDPWPGARGSNVVYAPAQHIVSTSGDNPGDLFSYASGTSYGAPLVAGVVALGREITRGELVNASAPLVKPPPPLVPFRILPAFQPLTNEIVLEMTRDDTYVLLESSPNLLEWTTAGMVRGVVKIKIDTNAPSIFYRFVQP